MGKCKGLLFVFSTVFTLLLASCQQIAEDVNTNDGQSLEAEEDVKSGSHEDGGDADGEDPDPAAGTSDEEEKVEGEPTPSYTLNENNWSLEPIDDSPEEAVLITIDDTPDEYGPEMAETLHDLGVTAIFFVNHHFINDEKGEEQLLEIMDYGHEIGNHTMSHPNLQEISKKEVEEEIVLLNDEVERITGERPTFFRAPHGANTKRSWEVLEDEGMLGMNWTYGFDWEEEYTDAEALAEVMVETEYLGNGANILMHDREWTNKALKDIIEGLVDEGYEFIEPSEIKLEKVSE
ncbi:peptidoglycan/xylan/chitin deacetylase (PgdA/CDA1 family) [Geomicrobium halophilum]|uniref:Peptidoglycan/xylan/chitin deacetylase (PgdA/CDA1 family) n=1 Tax=Geomicrobium halophilum TaxID=549000 RepID=A0A841PT08_9BACL|nr:polysaccharide deacetylase family protein [Geomicrobium halophilum]MBB6449441.1 peptidoglycan/xylan/chitin deacetylase (PgdA/CDA1 family) [Geomicrobium halophilum]